MTDDLQPGHAQVSYAVRIDGVVLPAGFHGVHEESVISLRIARVKDSAYRLSIRTQSLSAEDDVRAAAENFLARFAARLSLRHGARVSSPNFTGSTLPFGPNLDHWVTASEFGMALRFLPPPPPELSVDDVAEAIRQSTALSPATEVALTALRLALTQEDSVTSFMLLYNSLLQISQDDQKEVDANLLAIDGTIPVTIGHKGRPETLYTRLRNEIAHPRDGVELTTTVTEIERKRDQFVALAQAVLGKAANALSQPRTDVG